MSSIPQADGRKDSSTLSLLFAPTNLCSNSQRHPLSTRKRPTCVYSTPRKKFLGTLNCKRDIAKLQQCRSLIPVQVRGTVTQRRLSSTSTLNAQGTKTDHRSNERQINERSYPQQLPVYLSTDHRNTRLLTTNQTQRRSTSCRPLNETIFHPYTLKSSQKKKRVKRQSYALFNDKDNLGFRMYTLCN